MTDLSVDIVVWTLSLVMTMLTLRIGPVVRFGIDADFIRLTPIPGIRVSVGNRLVMTWLNRCGYLVEQGSMLIMWLRLYE